MTTPTADKSFVQQEPVLVAGFVTWLFSVLGTVILGHTDLISQSSWSSLTTTMVPVISAVVLGFVTWVTRKVVTPAWRALTTETEKLGLPDELVALLLKNASTQELADLKVKFPALAKVINDILAAQHGQG